jgi:hypothetical protein
MRSRALLEDHQLHSSGVPLSQRPIRGAKWIAPIAAAIALITSPLSPAQAPSPKEEVFLFGEVHRHQPSANYICNYLPHLKEKGYQSLALELPQSLEQEFQALLKGPLKETILYQKDGFPVHISQETLQTAKKAQELGFSIHCIDTDLSKKIFTDIEKVDRKLEKQQVTEKQYVAGVERALEKRNAIMAENLEKIPGKTAAVVGVFHTGGHQSLNDKLEKKGIPTRTLDLLPPKGPLSIDLFHTHQKPSDVVVRTPEHGVKRAHLSALEDPLTLDTLTDVVECAESPPPEKKPPRKEKKPRENPHQIESSFSPS